MRWFPWKQILTSGGVLAVILWRVPMAGLHRSFSHMQAENLWKATLCFAVVLLLRAYKWHGLMVSSGIRPLRASLRSLLGGCALGLITPGRLGELGRCVFVRKNERGEVALLTLLDRLLDFWALLTLAGISLFILTSRGVALFGVAVWLTSIPVVMGFPALVSSLARLARKSPRINAHFLDQAEQMPLHISTPRFAALAVCTVAVELSAFFYLLCAFSATRFTTALATYPYIIFAGDLPVTFGGIGVREGVAQSLLSPYAVPSGAAIGASLVWFVFAILMPAGLGAAWLVAERLRGNWLRVRGPVIPTEVP